MNKTLIAVLIALLSSITHAQTDRDIDNDDEWDR
jgi:hypothetical protein